jgi:hypothetical protein
MENDNAKSLYFFLFRLLPWEACLNFNFENLGLPDGFVAQGVRDQLILGVHHDSAPFDPLKDRAQRLALSLVDAYAYLGFPAHRAVDLEWTLWLEAKQCNPTMIMQGYGHPSLADAPLDPNHPTKALFLAAGALILHHDASAHLHLALSDFHAARRDPTAYASFYAFRVLEDVAYAFGRTSDKKGKEKPGWSAMNAEFGTTEAHWKALTDASVQARHLTNESLQPLPLQERDKLLALAKEAIDRFVAYLDKPEANPPSS